MLFFHLVSTDLTSRWSSRGLQYPGIVVGCRRGSVGDIMGVYFSRRCASLCQRKSSIDLAKTQFHPRLQCCVSTNYSREDYPTFGGKDGRPHRPHTARSTSTLPGDWLGETGTPADRAVGAFGGEESGEHGVPRRRRSVRARRTRQCKHQHTVVFLGRLPPVRWKHFRTSWRRYRATSACTDM